MATSTVILAFSLLLVIALLYSTVGHAGASGYLAVMAWLSFAPEEIRPTSLVLNCVVAAIASYRFISKGYFDFKTFLPFALAALPLAFLGGMITLPPWIFKLVAGIFLLVSAVLLMLKEYLPQAETADRKLPLAWGLLIGAGIGLLSGLVGVGGGIFLTPVLLLGNWADVRRTAGISALFILVNSLAGLGGQFLTHQPLNANLPWWILAVTIGGMIGSHLGAVKLNRKLIMAFLFLVLASAGIKFLFSAAGA